MDNEPEEQEFESVKTLGTHFRNASARIAESRPPSFYLLIALFVMLPLGTVMIGVRENPKQFALFLALHLVFLFVVLVRAVFDMIEIGGRHLKEREQLYGATLGDREFARELGRRVAQKRDAS